MGPLSQAWSFTNRLPIQVSPCAVQITAIGSQPMPQDQEVVEWRAKQCPPQAARRPSHLHRPPSYLQVPPRPPYTINRGCGARWKTSHLVLVISKLSKLLQLRFSYRVVVQQWSRARVELLGVRKSLLGLVQLLCNSFISALLYSVFILVLYSSIACFTLSTQSLVFIISELRCLLFGISSIGYLIISSLSLVLVPPSGQGALISFHRSSD